MASFPVVVAFVRALVYSSTVQDFLSLDSLFIVYRSVVESRDLWQCQLVIYSEATHVSILEHRTRNIEKAFRFDSHRLNLLNVFLLHVPTSFYDGSVVVTGRRCL